MVTSSPPLSWMVASWILQKAALAGYLTPRIRIVENFQPVGPAPCRWNRGCQSDPEMVKQNFPLHLIQVQQEEPRSAKNQEVDKNLSIILVRKLISEI